MFRTASVGTNKKRAIDHLINLCANIDCLNIAAIHGDQEEDELRSQTNTPLADEIIKVKKSSDDQIISRMKNDVMIPIAVRLGIDVTSTDPGQLDNHLVLLHQKACKANDHDTAVGTDYLRKLNVSFNTYNEDFNRIFFVRRLSSLIKIYHYGNVLNDSRKKFSRVHRLNRQNTNDFVNRKSKGLLNLSKEFLIGPIREN